MGDFDLAIPALKQNCLLSNTKIVFPGQPRMDTCESRWKQVERRIPSGGSVARGIALREIV
jgi:hypothetical protein